MDNPAKATDLAARDFDVTSQAIAQTRLDEAWRALQAEVPSLLPRIADGTLSADLVIDVLCSAALRVLKNPDNLERFSGSIDDYREEGAIAKSAQTDDLFFTRSELRRVRPLDSYGFGAGSMAYS